MTEATLRVTARAVEATPSVVVVGPLPPPLHGCAVATRFVLASELASRCRIVHLNTTDDRGLDNIGRLDAGNVALAIRHAVRLASLIATERPRLVYLPMAQNTWGVVRDVVLAAIVLGSRRRLVVHLHGGGFRAFYDGASPPLRAVVRHVLRRASRVIVLGESLRFMLDGIVPPAAAAVLPNGVDDPWRDLPDRARRAGVVRLLYLGHLMEAKGFMDLLDAAALLLEGGVPIELDVAGDYGSPRDRRTALARVERLGRAVTLHGVVTGAQKQRLLAGADVFVFPSHSEGHPYVVLEAMAAGLPIVATELPGVAETVHDGTTGLLVPPRDVPALAAAVRRLVEDGRLRQRLGEAGRSRYESNYTLARWSRGLHDIVAEALA